MATTRTDYGKEFIKPEKIKISPQQQCEQSGGIWDAQTQTCIRLSKQTPTTTTKTTTPKSSTKNGVIDKEGNAITPEQNAARLKEFEFLAASQGRSAMAQIQQREALAQQQQDLLNTPQMEVTPDGRQIIKEGGIVENLATGGAAIGGAIAGAKFGAVGGAALGSVVPGLGTAVGGLVGGIGGGVVGAIGGAYVKLKIQKGQDIKEANKVFSQAKTNKQEILNMINANLVTEGQARELWQEEKQNIAATQTYLKRQTQSDLNAFLGNPGDELIAVESYLTLDNLYDLEFEKALIQPDQTKIRFPQSE
jgi:hypothetical protein